MQVWSKKNPESMAGGNWFAANLLLADLDGREASKRFFIEV
jgi:hypothetical protein